MKKLIILITLVESIVYPQRCNAKVINNISQGLSDKRVAIYFVNDGISILYNAFKLSFVNFLKDFISTDITEYKTLSNGYSIAFNYPNIFNFKTFINVTLLHTTKIKIII